MPTVRSLRRESALLLWCIRASIDGAADDPPSADESGIDWTYLLDVACAAGVAPLVGDVLESILRGRAPAPVLDGLRRHRWANRAAAVLRSRELATVLGAFHERCTSVVVLKGAALAESVYAAPALRPAGDIDLLVRESDVSKAEDALVQLGYLRREAEPGSTAADYHVEYAKRGVVPIEIHWNLAEPSAQRRFDLDGVWRRAVRERIAGQPALVMAPDDLVLYLCGHSACNHKLKRALQGVCDLSLTIRRHGATLDWSSIRRGSRRLDLDKYTFLMLELSRSLLNTPVPVSILAALRPHGLRSAVLVEAARTVVEGYVDSPVTSTFVQFWTGDGAAVRAQAVARALSPRSVAHRYAVPIGSARTYLHYPARVLDLMGHYVPVITRLCLGDRRSREMIDRERALLTFDDWLSS